MVIKMGADGQICDSISYVGTVLRGNTKLKQEDVLIPTSWLTDASISATTIRLWALVLSADKIV